MPFKIAKGDTLVDDQAPRFTVELRQVAGVGHVGTVDGARADRVDGRLRDSMVWIARPEVWVRSTSDSP